MEFGTTTPAAPAAPAAPNQATAAGPTPAVPPVMSPAAVAPSTPDAAAPNTAGAPLVAEVAAVPAADPRADVNALAERFGYSPAQVAHYPNAAALQDAIRFETEQLANLGLQGIQQPQQYAQPQFQTPSPVPPSPQVAAPAAPAAVVALDLKTLGIDEDEPVAKAVRALEKQLADGLGGSKALESRLAQIEARHSAAVREKTASEATAFVDKLASPIYGVAGSRTYAQQRALQQLYDAADAVLTGAALAGRPIPSVAQRLARAQFMLEREAAPALGVAPVNEPVLRQASPAGGGAPPDMRMTDRWAESPKIAALLARANADN